MKTVKFIVLLLLALVFIIFCVVNHGPVTISLFPVPYSFDIPVFVLALLSMAFGVMITGVVMNIKLLKNYSSNRKTIQRMQAVENEIKALRSEREQSLPALPKRS